MATPRPTGGGDRDEGEGEEDSGEMDKATTVPVDPGTAPDQMDDDPEDEDDYEETETPATMAPTSDSDSDRGGGEGGGGSSGDFKFSVGQSWNYNLATPVKVDVDVDVFFIDMGELLHFKTPFLAMLLHFFVVVDRKRLIDKRPTSGRTGARYVYCCVILCGVVLWFVAAVCFGVSI